MTLNYYSRTGFFKQEFREDLAPTPLALPAPFPRGP